MEEAAKKHPLEYAAEQTRILENPYGRMNEKSLLLTNFPKGLKVSKAYIKELCLSKCPKGASIEKIIIQEAQVGTNPEVRNKVAYVIIQFDEESHALSVRRALWRKWIDDKLLKIKSKKDEQVENHGDRTLILSNIPSHLRQEDIASFMAKYGAITSIEAPSMDSYI